MNNFYNFPTEITRGLASLARKGRTEGPLWRTLGSFKGLAQQNTGFFNRFPLGRG